MTVSLAQPVPALSTPAGWLHARAVDPVGAALAPLRAAAERARDRALVGHLGALAGVMARAVDGATDVRALLLPGVDQPLPLALVVRELASPASVMDARIRDAVHLRGASGLEGAENVLRWVQRDRDGDVLVQTSSYLAIAPGSARTQAMLVTATAIATVVDPAPLQTLGAIADAVVESMQWLSADDAAALERAVEVSRG